MDRRLLLIIASCGLALASVLLWLQAALALNNVWVVLCLLSVQQAFYRDQLPDAVGGDSADAAGRPAARGQLTEHDRDAVRRDRRAAAGRGDAALGRPVHAVSDRRDHLRGADLGDVPARADAAAPTAAQGSSGWGFGAVLDGFRYLAGNQVVLMSFVVDLIAMIFGMPRALFPQMAHESFGGPVEGGTTMALLAAAMSAGAVAGGVFSGWLPRIRRQGLAVVIAIVVWGVAMVGFGLAGGLAHGQPDDAVDCVGVLGDWRCRRHGVGGVPVDDSAAGGVRRTARPAAGRVHRRGGRRPPAGRRGARRGGGGGRHDRCRGGRWRAGGGRRGDRRTGRARVRPLPGGRQATKSDPRQVSGVATF